VLVGLSVISFAVMAAASGASPVRKVFDVIIIKFVINDKSFINGNLILFSHGPTTNGSHSVK